MVPWQLTAPARAEREKHSPKHLPAQGRRGSSGVTGGSSWRPRWRSCWLRSRALYVSYRQIELPDTLPPIKTSYLYDRHGNELTPLHGAVDRTIVPLGQISENLQHAVIATEDAGFY